MTRPTLVCRAAAALAVLSAGVLATARTEAARPDDRPIRALLVIGGCCHEYAKQKDIITKGVSARANVQWAVAYDPDTTTKHLNPVYEKDDWAKGFDVVVHDECSSDVKEVEYVENILAAHRKGVPAVNLHCAMHCYRVGEIQKPVKPGSPGHVDGSTAMFAKKLAGSW